MIKRIAVCGLGKLGSPMAASFATVARMFVCGYDLDAEKVHAINHAKAPVEEPGLQKAVSAAGLLLRATTDPAEAVERTQACIFVAPTPSLPDGSFDNQYLLAGIEKIAPAVGNRPYIFVIASTVTPGSCEKILLPAIRRHSPCIQLAYKPELIALGTVMYDLANPDVALIGADNEETIDEVFGLYARLQTGKDTLPPRTICFETMSLVEAELAKISLNCAITMKISFANQVSMVAQQYGADPNTILNFVGRDSRIGRKALRPGMPYGGPCFPRDNRMFQYAARKVDVFAHLATATDLTNNEILAYILRSIPADGDVGILGLAYKPGAIITEEAAGTMIQNNLVEQGRTVFSHDPLLSPDGLEDVAACRTVVITTDCPEYRNLQFRPDQCVVDPMGISQKRRLAT